MSECKHEAEQHHRYDDTCVVSDNGITRAVFRCKHCKKLWLNEWEVIPAA